MLRFLPIDYEPELRGVDQIHEEISYPIQSSDELDGYLGKDLLAVYEYVISDIEEGCVGVYFDFGDSGFSILESDDNLSIIDGRVMVSDDVVLSRLKI